MKRAIIESMSGVYSGIMINKPYHESIYVDIHAAVHEATEIY
jgi:hypothetical protein